MKTLEVLADVWVRSTISRKNFSRAKQVLIKGKSMEKALIVIIGTFKEVIHRRDYVSSPSRDVKGALNNGEITSIIYSLE